jgi:hypothetical protein
MHHVHICWPHYLYPWEFFLLKSMIEGGLMDDDDDDDDDDDCAAGVYTEMLCTDEQL